METVQAYRHQKLQQLYFLKHKHWLSKLFSLFRNLTSLINNNKQPEGTYDGYTSCPILVGNNKLMLAEFKYDGVVDETFLNNQ